MWLPSPTRTGRAVGRVAALEYPVLSFVTGALIMLWSVGRSEGASIRVLCGVHHHMTGSSEAGRRERRRAPHAIRTIAASPTSNPLKSHWLVTLSAGAALNNVIQVLAKIWNNWTSSRLPSVLLNIQLTTMAPAMDPITNTGRPAAA